MQDKIRRMVRSWRIITLIAFVALSLLLITNVLPVNRDAGIGFGNGLEYGRDFAGGTEIKFLLEEPANGSLTADVLDLEKSILERRINSMGLRDIPVRSEGGRYIVIQIASASPQEVGEIENILKQQARFEALIDGELAISGSDVSVDLGQGGSGVIPSGGSYQWYVAIRLTREGGERFCEVGADKRGKPIDMFLDRPEGAVLFLDLATYAALGDFTEDERDRTSDNYVQIIENRSRVPVIVVENNTLDMSALEAYTGYSRAILGASEEEISETIRNQLEEAGFATDRKPREGRDTVEWIREVIGLTSSPVLRCDPCNQCKYSAQISGGDLSMEAALKDMEETKILLSSGNLPAKAVVESKSEIDAALGEKFLEYSFMIGVIAIFTVAAMIYLRYRALFIVGPTIITGLSEIIIILGIAALVNWELDLPAVAGIIAAVGTGVDDQIVITDETIKRREEKLKKSLSLVERIRRAFFIIFTAAATTIAVMVPVLSIQALKGFAFMTIIGVVIGVFVTRPAYAKIVEEFLRE